MWFLQETPRYYWPNGDRVEMGRLTEKQIKSLEEIVVRYEMDTRVTIHPGPGECVMVPVGGMWIGVEADGHKHT